jgi:hypothetical protein
MTTDRAGYQIVQATYSAAGTIHTINYLPTPASAEIDCSASCQAIFTTQDCALETKSPEFRGVAKLQPHHQPGESRRVPVRHYSLDLGLPRMAGQSFARGL